MSQFSQRFSFWPAVLSAAFLSTIGNSTAASRDVAVIGMPSVEDSQELQLGEQADSWFTGTLPVLRPNNPITQRVNALVQSLVPYCDRTNLNYRTTVINDPADINAYAGPGGYIYVTTGFLQFIEDPDELALSLTHELAHVSRRHAAATLRQSKSANAWMTVIRGVTSLASMGSASLGAYYQVNSFIKPGSVTLSTASQLGMAAVPSAELLINAAAMSVTTMALTGYGEEREAEADRLGITYIKRHGQYNPAAAINLFRRFDLLEKRVGNAKEDRAKMLKFVSSLNAHPSTKLRIEQAERQLSELNVAAQRSHVISEVKVPDVLHTNLGPSQIGPEILPVRPDEAWFHLIRLVKSDPRTQEVKLVSTQPANRLMDIRMGTDIAFLRVRMRPGEPAGVEVTANSDSIYRDWWPSIIMEQLRAELGVVEYSCLKGIEPAPARALDNELVLSGTQAGVLACLEATLPWWLLEKNEDMGYLYWQAWEGGRPVRIAIFVSPDASGRCQAYVRQGPMDTQGKPGVKWVFDVLTKHGFARGRTGDLN